MYQYNFDIVLEKYNYIHITKFESFIRFEYILYEHLDKTLKSTPKYS